MANSFEEDNLRWQIQKLQQQLGEWWEWQTSQWNIEVSSPDSEPSWWDSPIPWMILQGIFWVAVAALLSWLAILLMRSLDPYFYSLKQQLNLSLTNQQSGNPVSTSDWLKKAKKYQEQGDYGEGCRCLYFAMLQRLHDAKLISHQPSRTDGEYQQLVSQFPKSDPYKTLLKIHEQLVFGKINPSDLLFEKSQQAYQDIQNSLKEP